MIEEEERQRLEDEEAAKNKEKPNFERSGKLAEAHSGVNGVILKWHEPPEARPPTSKWRIYVFKGDEEVGG